MLTQSFVLLTSLMSLFQPDENRTPGKPKVLVYCTIWTNLFSDNLDLTNSVLI